METQKSVIVYHYDGELAEVIADALKNRNYNAQYRVVTRGIKAGEIATEIAQKKPDLVFLPLNFGEGIPSKNGLVRYQEGLEELVRIRGKSKVPVVMVTGGGNTYREEALRRGANEYLPIPFELKQLFELANKYI